MRDRIDHEHQYLSLDYPSEIVYDGRAYTCAATLYLALANPHMVRRLTRPTTGPEGWRIADDPHDEAAMRTAVYEKFRDRDLADRLLEEEFVLYVGDDATWCITDEEAGLGENLCGAIHEDVRDQIAHEREVATRDRSYMIPDVWPGHIAPSIYGDDVVWLRIPSMEVRGTLSTIVPKDDIEESDKVIARGKFQGRHYLDVYLTQDSYPIAHHDEDGQIQTLAVASRYSREQLYRTFMSGRRRDMERRRAQRQSRVRIERRRNNPDAVATIRPGVWPRFDYEVHPRPDETLGCELIMVNTENHNRIDISVPVVCDAPPIADETIIACDPTGIELVIDCALADGAIWPALVAQPDGRRRFVQFDQDERFAWVMFNVAPDIILKQTDEAYLDYLRKGHRKIGQARKDWRDIMPVREGHGSIRDTVTRICKLANESDPARRRRLVEEWLEQGVYSAKPTD